MTDFTISEVVRILGVKEQTIKKYLCRAEFFHIKQKRKDKSTVLTNVKPCDLKRFQELASRSLPKMNEEELKQYDSVIQQNHKFQQELRVKNKVIFNIVNAYEPELLTMEEIIKRYGDNQ